MYLNLLINIQIKENQIKIKKKYGMFLTIHILIFKKANPQLY